MVTMADETTHSETTDYDSQDERPPERLAPVGSSEICDDYCSNYDYGEFSETDRLQRLEEEQEHLNSSLMALTSHFAQVQFRLKQIVDASQDEKEKLLKDLEDFAFRGIPDWECKSSFNLKNLLTEQEHEEKLAEQRMKQMQLIEQLKDQLQDLEQYAYETGDAGMPQSMVMERQSVIIEQLKGKLPIDLDGLEQMSPDELRMQVDKAIRELVNPVKMKEQLVGQLKTQITDLERFIEFLQGEAQSKFQPRCTCNCPVHGDNQNFDSDSTDRELCKRKGHRHKMNFRESQKIQGTSIRLVRRALALLQMFTIAQFGCGGQTFEKNLLKKTMKANHYGDLRAQLEVAINQVIDVLAHQEPMYADSDYTSDSDDAPVVMCNEKLTSVVRKDLTSAIRDLLQHGLMPIGQNTSLVPLGCFPMRSANATKMMHAWDLIVKYYELKNGRQYNASPARRLSQSFNLDIVGGTAVTAKQTLLGAVDNVISTHTPLKRSADSHFKAFVCAALNEKKLVCWLRLVLRCRHLVEQYYQPWSYVAKTGFEDSFRSLDKLHQYQFDLPVDLAIRQLQNIKDAF